MSLARIHKGDNVVVLSGKDKGKKGKVLRSSETVSSSRR
jgi:ribosomal protein L24